MDHSKHSAKGTPITCDPVLEQLRTDVAAAGDVKSAVSKLVCGVSDMVRALPGDPAGPAVVLAAHLDSSTQCLAEAVVCNVPPQP